MKSLILLFVTGVATAAGQIVVDGDPSEWTGTAPGTENTFVYSSQSAGTTSRMNEWIWRDAVNDFRTDFSPTLDDLLEIRLSSDGQNLYYICRVPPNQGTPPVELQITIRRPGSASTQRNIPGFTETLVPESAAWDYAIVTPSGSGGSANKVYTPDFTMSSVGAYAQNPATGVLEGSVPWSALGGQPASLTFLFTFSIYRADGSDNAVDIAGSTSNCLDCVTTTPGQTWGIVQSGSLDYAASVRFIGDNEVLQVRLGTFSAAEAAGGDVRLEWTTLSEVNNYGFVVERSAEKTTGYAPVSAVIPGHGTSTTGFAYEYADRNIPAGTQYYRLKQIDLDNTIHFSDPVMLRTTDGGGSAPIVFALSQNYPNPFNPSTEFRFSVARTGLATLMVYNTMGQEVRRVFDGETEAGKFYTVRFDGSLLASGVYYARLQCGSESRMRKIVLMK